jgi:hypothetical protein
MPSSCQRFQRLDVADPQFDVGVMLALGIERCAPAALCDSPQARHG